MKLTIKEPGLGVQPVPSEMGSRAVARGAAPPPPRGASCRRSASSPAAAAGVINDLQALLLGELPLRGPSSAGQHRSAPRDTGRERTFEGRVALGGSPPRALCARRAWRGPTPSGRPKPRAPWRPPAARRRATRGGRGTPWGETSATPSEGEEEERGTPRARCITGRRRRPSSRAPWGEGRGGGLRALRRRRSSRLLTCAARRARP